MSQLRAILEIERFLSTEKPEVLSVSGRWGVGKTFAWDCTLKAKRATTPLRQYAYVSAFGLRSLDALKTAIVQSTVSLEGNELEPTVESFIEHVSTFTGLRKLSGETARKGLNIFSKGAAAIPYIGKMADLLAPGAALLIRNQIICIDDIERAGQGLDVADILGLVSSLRERRNCKVVLLLNEDGLGEQGPKYREYLEKVVDQAIKFEPTPQESSRAALDKPDPLGDLLLKKTERLGITNIRVIRRIRRFLSHIEPQLAGLHIGVTETVIHSMALLGWCVFEPKLAPNLEQVQRYNRFSGLFSEKKSSLESKKVGQFLHAYGFGEFDEVDSILLAGLKAGAFEFSKLQAALAEMDQKLSKSDARQAIAKPWSILGESFDDVESEFKTALIESVEKYAADMSPGELDDVLSTLKELGDATSADRLLQVYMEAQVDRAREFFSLSSHTMSRPLDPKIVAEFDAKLATMPLTREPAEILRKIDKNKSWNPDDETFLSALSIDDYYNMLKGVRGDDLRSVVHAGLLFSEFQEKNPAHKEIGQNMKAALARLGSENGLNLLRVRPYLGREEEEREADTPEILPDAD